ncbi:hypothetical protein CF327_g7237 [Tilletia walkeri]|nr:hypothetical protein CF327_g7237 [Tilletia walkeri]
MNDEVEEDEIDDGEDSIANNNKMNSLTLIDSVLTRSFSTSAVPQRRRATSSPAADTHSHDDSSIPQHEHQQQQQQQLEQQQQQQQQRRQRRQSRKQESEPTPRSRSSPPSQTIDIDDEEEEHDDHNTDPLNRQRQLLQGNNLPQAAYTPPLPDTAVKEPETEADPAPPPAVEASEQPPAPTPPPTRPIPRGPTSVIRHTPKILVLDLDETLIHSTSRPRPGYELAASKHVAGGVGAGGALFGGGFGFGRLIGLDGLGALLGLRGRAHSGRLRTHTVEVVLGGRSLVYHVYKRPWVDYFLRKVAAWYHVVVYTASVQEYANPVIDWLDQGRGLIHGRLFRDACIFSNGTYLKNLSIVDSDLARVCLVDNSPASYLINPANGIPIEGWTHDPNDEALLDLLPVLDSLRFANDVRHILGLRGF